MDSKSGGASHSPTTYLCNRRFAPRIKRKGGKLPPLQYPIRRANFTTRSVISRSKRSISRCDSNISLAQPYASPEFPIRRANFTTRSVISRSQRSISRCDSNISLAQPYASLEFPIRRANFTTRSVISRSERSISRCGSNISLA